MNDTDYIERISSLAGQRKGSTPLLIAIDGHSAAGKSTLARRLAASMGNTAVIYTDDFYRPMPEDRRFKLDVQEGYAYYYDWQRLKDEVLEPLSLSENAEFRIYDWQNNQLGEWKKVQPKKFIIVEGCYSARPELSPFFSIIVLVKTSAEERQKRQIERNDATQAWLARWDAAERFYMETTDLLSRADVVVTGCTASKP